MVDSSTAAAIIVVAVVGIIVLVLVLSVIAPRREEPKFDIEKEIAILNKDRPAFAKFSLREADWEESKEQSEAHGTTFVEVKD
jgi:hypothetical protein